MWKTFTNHGRFGTQPVAPRPKASLREPKAVETTQVLPANENLFGWRPGGDWLQI